MTKLEFLEKMKNQTVILPVGIPWKSVLVPSEALFVVYPSARGGYNAQAIPISLGDKPPKKFAYFFISSKEKPIINIMSLFFYCSSITSTKLSSS